MVTEGDQEGELQLNKKLTDLPDGSGLILVGRFGHVAPKHHKVRLRFGDGFQHQLFMDCRQRIVAVPVCHVQNGKFAVFVELQTRAGVRSKGDRRKPERCQRQKQQAGEQQGSDPFHKIAPSS